MKNYYTLSGINKYMFLVLVMFIFSVGFVKGQSASSFIKKGEIEFGNNNIESAVDLFEQALLIEKDNNTAAYFAGIGYFKLSSPEKALHKFSLIYPEEFKYKDVYYWLALVNYKNNQFDKATQFIGYHRDRYKNFMLEEIADLEKKNELAKGFYEKEQEFKIENLGDNINSENSEYSAVLTADHRTIHFTTKRKDNKGGVWNGQYMEDILSSTLNEEDRWEKAERLQGVVTIGHDATIQLFEEDTKMIIYKKEDLFITELNNGKWSNPKPIGKEINKSYSRESHGFISKDGNTLIFSSDIKSKNEDLDLFISTKDENNEWGKPRPLDEINTEFDEDSPFIDEDGTLYFSSKGHNSMGGFDIFKSEFNSTFQEYSKPINLGYPINSVSDDIFFNVKNKIAYFTSSRVGGLGREDIYRAYLFKNIDIELNFVSKENDLPFSGAVVHLNSNEQNFNFITDASGKVYGTIPAFNNFDVQLIKDGDTLHTQTITPITSLRNPTKFSETIKFTLPETKEILVSTKDNLDKNGNVLAVDTNTIKQEEVVKLDESLIEKKSTFVFKRIYFDHDKATLKSESFEELNLVVSYLKRNEGIKAEIGGHTDNVGSFEYNQTLSFKRAKAVVDYLVENGISSDRLQAKGYGETRPIASNDEEYEGREINRRIEFKVLKEVVEGISKNE